MHVFIAFSKKTHRNCGDLSCGSVDAGSRCRGIARFDRLTRKKLNLPDKKSLLIGELVVVGAVFKEFRQELKQPIPIIYQNPLYGHRFVRVCDKYLRRTIP